MKGVSVIAMFSLCVLALSSCGPSQPKPPNPGAVPAPAGESAAQPAAMLAKDLTLDLGKGVTMKLVLVPAGKFLMGSPKDEKDRFNNEGPRHEVTISKPFYMGIYEVTQEQWTAVMGTTPWKGEEFAKDGATHAASHINWNDAAAFCKKLSAKTGKTVSLPTEAQWEYACRAGSQTRFCYGDDADYSKLGDYAWCDKNSWDVGQRYAHTVGQKKANAFGLYDMHGNVWEWCADWWEDSYANAGKADPTGPASGSYRVLRGGSFEDIVWFCRSAYREYFDPTYVWFISGLRVAVVAAGVEKSPATSTQPPNPPSQTKPPNQAPVPAPTGEPATHPAATLAKDLTLNLGDGVTMKLVLIPAGKFMMGSPESEKGRDNNETQHEVTISKPFYMGITHVTVDQFAAFVKDSGYKTDAEKDGWSPGFEIKDGMLAAKKMDGCSWRNPSFDQKGDHPVVQVSWNDAKAFCVWLSTKTGKKVVLPTEAQWEYACRAGTKTAYPWGDDRDAGKGWANCADQSLKKKVPNAPAEWFFRWDDGFVFTSPVGNFKANAFGLYDMIGNAYQWCGDWYADYEKGATTDPTGPAFGRHHVLRGGSWGNDPAYCRSAYRGGYFLVGRIACLGFRVVVVAAGGGGF